MRTAANTGALALAVVLVAPVSLQARGPCTLFVKENHLPPGGSPADGRSVATAFAAIGDAARAVNNPGEVICVGPGRYREGNITPGWYGTESFPITFLADTGGTQTEELRGPVELVMPTAPTVETVGFLLLGHHHIVIDGFTIRGFADAAIQVRSATKASGPAGLGNSHDVVVRNNEVLENAGSGIDVSAEGVVIVENNHVAGNGAVGISIRSCVDEIPPLPDEAPGDARCAVGPGAPVEPRISNNRVERSGADGILLEQSENGLVQNNRILSNRATGVTLRSSADCLVVNNLVYDNGDDGLAVGTADMASPDAVILNNTIFGNLGWGLRIGSSSSASPGSIVLNNIVSENGRADEGSGGIAVASEADLRLPSTCGYIAGFNIVHGNAGDRNYGPDTPFNVYDIKADPELADPDGVDDVLGGVGAADDDFRLRPTSPALDAGFATAEEVGLQGVTVGDPGGEEGALDTGALDLGFHAGALPQQVISVPPPAMPIYVRQGAEGGVTGKSPSDAFGTIGAAALRARAGVTVHVAAGVYQECDLGPPPRAGVAAFVADTRRVGAPPVTVDASCCGPFCEPGMTAFNILRSCGVRVEGFHLTGALDAGIQIQSGSHNAVVRDNVAFDNLRLGIQVVNADDVHIVNNLAFRNGFVDDDRALRGGGIQIGGACATSPCTEGGSQRALVEGNTCYGNGVNGILIGTGAGSSGLATVRYNILQANGENGIQVGANGNSEAHLDDEYALRSRFNITADGYGGGTPRGFGDLVIDPQLDMDLYPLLLDPEGGDFHLPQRGARQAEQSWAVDYADIDAVMVGMGAQSTRSDHLPDTGRLDVGYHYPACGSSAVGDCNGDGSVSVSELVLGVGIALGEMAVTACEGLDGDADGVVGVQELVLAVQNSLIGCI